MSKIKFLAAVIFICSLTITGQSESFSADDLTNGLSRAISLKETFFQRFETLDNGNIFALPIEEGNIYLDGVWYTGYSIETEYGDQEGILGRVYGDIYASYATENWLFSTGAGGYRYGVFLSDISLPVPEDDPAQDPIVTDFTGSQIFQDIYTLHLSNFRGYSLGGYVVHNRNIQPNQGTVELGELLTESFYLGLKTKISGVVSGDALITTQGEWVDGSIGLDVLNLIKLIRGRTYSHQAELQTMVRWTNRLESPLDLEDFQIPIAFSYPLSSQYYITAGMVLDGLNFQNMEEFNIYTGMIELQYIRSVYLVQLGVSYHYDNRLEGLGVEQNYLLGGELGGAFITPFLTLKGMVRYNYSSDLGDLIEVADKTVFEFNLSYPLRTDFGQSRRPIRSNVSVEEVSETQNEDKAVENDIPVDKKP